MDKLAKAESLLETNLRLARQHWPGEGRDLSTLNNLAVLKSALGLEAEEWEIHQQILRLSSRRSGKDALRTTNLARAHIGRGEYDQAESLLLETIEGHRKVLGESNRVFLHMKDSLAHLRDSSSLPW